MFELKMLGKNFLTFDIKMCIFEFQKIKSTPENINWPTAFKTKMLHVVQKNVWKKKSTTRNDKENTNNATKKSAALPKWNGERLGAGNSISFRGIF